MRWKLCWKTSDLSMLMLPRCALKLPQNEVRQLLIEQLIAMRRPRQPGHGGLDQVRRSTSKLTPAGDGVEHEMCTAREASTPALTKLDIFLGIASVEAGCAERGLPGNALLHTLKVVGEGWSCRRRNRQEWQTLRGARREAESEVISRRVLALQVAMPCIGPEGPMPAPGISVAPILASLLVNLNSWRCVWQVQGSPHDITLNAEH